LLLLLVVLLVVLLVCALLLVLPLLPLLLFWLLLLPCMTAWSCSGAQQLLSSIWCKGQAAAVLNDGPAAHTQVELAVMGAVDAHLQQQQQQ
jgi:hypothetical protein